MNTTRFPRVFCWTKMGHEAGQPLQVIISRKESERKRGAGVFFWGIGTALGQKIWSFIERTRKPVVVFSPMKAKPRPVDVAPKEVFAWTAYLDRQGCKHPLPEHALVLSRGNVSTATKKHHYALVCKKQTPLLHETWPTIDWNTLANFNGDSRLGFSQVTAVVEERNRNQQNGLRYEVLFSAELVAPYYITLVEPVAVSKSRLAEVSRVCTNDSGASTVEAVVCTSDGAQRAVQSKGDFTQVDLERARMRFGGIDKLQWALSALT